jgi:hypothetical protein
MILYPKYYCKKITDIDIAFLEKNNIKALILDVDNTLIDTDRVLLDGLEKWHTDICNSGIKTIILSNSNKVDKVSSVAKALGIEYIYFGTKPLKRGFKKAIEKLQLPPENIAAVGDQIFTDVIGANRCKLFPILVEPINEKDLLITKWKRPIEEKIIKKYLKNK